MREEEKKEFVDMIKNSRYEMGENYRVAVKKAEEDVKNRLSEEQLRVWETIDNPEQEKQIIEEIGNDKYCEILDEIGEIFKELLK